jgi:hypothetical protein
VNTSGYCKSKYGPLIYLGISKAHGIDKALGPTAALKHSYAFSFTAKKEK